MVLPEMKDYEKQCKMVSDLSPTTLTGKHSFSEYISVLCLLELLVCAFPCLPSGGTTNTVTDKLK